nr:PREDICTED: uncharacterized protein LOC109033013 [Bemisia tabaci]
MRAYLVLTICSVTGALASVIPPPAFVGPRTTALEVKIGQQSTDVPVLDLNQFCELLESDEQRTQCLDYVSKHVIVGPQTPEGLKTDDKKEKNQKENPWKLRGEFDRIPLDLQVFVPSENSWYLQDSHNHKFLGKPLIRDDKKPVSSTDGSDGKRETLVRL